jgi:hypothetical protein
MIESFMHKGLEELFGKGIGGDEAELAQVGQFLPFAIVRNRVARLLVALAIALQVPLMK